MADAMFMYTVATGVFAFLTAIVFGTRARRYSSGWKADMMTTSGEGHT